MAIGDANAADSDIWLQFFGFLPDNILSFLQHFFEHSCHLRVRIDVFQIRRRLQLFVLGFFRLKLRLLLFKLELILVPFSLHLLDELLLLFDLFEKFG